MSAPPNPINIILWLIVVVIVIVILFIVLKFLMGVLFIAPIIAATPVVYTETIGQVSLTASSWAVPVIEAAVF